MDRQERSIIALHIQTLSRWLKNNGKLEPAERAANGRDHRRH